MIRNEVWPFGKRSRLKVVYSLIALVGLGTAGNLLLVDKPAVADEPESSVLVGVLMPLSGDFAYVGETAKKAILASKRPPNVNFVFEDSGCNGVKALSAYTKLSKIDGVRLFLGPCCGSEFESIAPSLKANGNLMLSLCSSTGGLFIRSQKRLLSPVFSIERESQFVAKHLESAGYRKIAVVYMSNAFSLAHELAFTEALGTAKITSYTFDTFDPEAVRSIALKLKSNPPDAIYVPDLTPFLLSFASKLRKLGLKTIPIFSIHAAQTPDIITAEAGYADGIVYSHADIGEENADSYYPSRAVSLLSDALAQCGDRVDCVEEFLLKHNPFSADGTMDGNLILKTIVDGKFIPLPRKSAEARDG